MTTKRVLIQAAYAELALAAYDFDISPEEMQEAARRLDALMGTWAAQGLQISYAFGDDIDSESGLAAVAYEAVVLALSVRLAPGKGKQLAASTLRNAKAAYDSLVSLLAQRQVARQQRPNGTPAGAGNKPWRNSSQPFLPAPSLDLLQNGAGGLEFTEA